MTNSHTDTSVLAVTRQRWMAVASLNASLAALSFAGLAALVALAADAMLDLSDATRVALPWLIGFGAFGVLALGLANLRRLGELRLARVLERRDLALGNALTNAVQLAVATAEGA